MGCLSRRGRGASLATLAVVAVLGAPAVGMVWPAVARAQASEQDGRLDLERIVGAVANLVAQLAETGSERVFQFLETVELFDAEAEIDRLAGNPRELNDSTAYKLSLLPFHIRYPIYKQLVRQMTRQDELRSRRIHNVTPGSANLIALRVESLTDENVEEIRRSLLTHFNARELIDLGFFILAQQRFFPETDEGWRDLRQRIASGGAALAMGALALGAAFDVGALTRSGTVKRLSGDARLGWYAGFRRLGLRFQPQIRGGLTLHVPGLEAAAGLWRQVRGTPADARTALEVAIREGWVNRLTSPHGWDAFFEGAIRHVLTAGPDHDEQALSTRTGFFFKRDYIPRLPNVRLRGSAEMDLHVGGEVHFAVGLGFDHVPSNLSTVLQASRTPAVGPGLGPMQIDKRGGIFLAGTMESPIDGFIGTMRARARQAHDEWDVLRALDRRRDALELQLRWLTTGRTPRTRAGAVVHEFERTLAAREEHLARLAERLAEYLESRRVAYSIASWRRGEDDLYGPLDADVLQEARRRVFLRVRELSGDLALTPPRLARFHRRFQAVQETMRALQSHDQNSTALSGYQQELAEIDRRLQGESEAVSARLHSYLHYQENARRMLAVTRRSPEPGLADGLRLDILRRIIALKTLSLR